MIVKYKERRINLDNVVEWHPSEEVLKFFVPGEMVESICLHMGSPEMAERSMGMIDRHIARSRGSCNLDLLALYDVEGWKVLATEAIRRTINRIGGRLGF